MERDLSLQPGLEAVIQQSSLPPTSHYQQIPGTPYTGSTEYAMPEKPHGPYASNYPGPPEGGPPATSVSPQERKILGLRVVTFTLVCIIIALIVVGAVGGGVAGNAAVTNAKNACLSNSSPTTSATGGMITSSSTSTSTSTSATNSIFYGFNTASAVTTVWGPEATVLPYTGCPGNDQTIYTSLQSINQSAKFKILCDINIPWNAKSDILGVNSNSLQLCIEACGSWNNLGVSASGGNSNVPCAGVAFVPDWTNGDPLSNTPNNCFLKSNQTTSQLVATPGTDSAIMISP